MRMSELHDYSKLFKFIQELETKQAQQKLRGLNDYNMVNVVRSAFHEVGMHSNVIYSLINPNGLHYQNDLFLNLFIEHVLDFSVESFGKVLEVNVEEGTDEKRRIDFTIKSENYFIGIEMKVNAGDLNNQISHYDDYLNREADNQQVYMYYLTKDGKDAPQSSKRNVHIKRVSFQEHILNWLDACQDEVKNITNLNVALEDYKDIVKKITHQYKGNVVNIEDELLKSKEYLKTTFMLRDKMNIIQGKTLHKFFEDVRNSLGDEQDITDITGDIKDQNRVADLRKCKALYSQARNAPKHFGIYFDCKFGHSLYLSVELHIRNVYYGLIRLEEFEMKSLSEDDNKYFPDGKFSFDGTFSKGRYVKHNPLKTLLDDNILDFPNSELKTNILRLIEEVREATN